MARRKPAARVQGHGQVSLSQPAALPPGEESHCCGRNRTYVLSQFVNESLTPASPGCKQPHEVTLSLNARRGRTIPRTAPVRRCCRTLRDRSGEVVLGLANGREDRDRIAAVEAHGAGHFGGVRTQEGICLL